MAKCSPSRSRRVTLWARYAEWSPPTVRSVRRFVALGDSLTEGVGDPHAAHPNGWRGWADVLAAHLARHDEGVEYVNLALRAKRVRHVLEEQVPVTTTLAPSVVTVWAGGNDILRPTGRVQAVEQTMEACIDELVRTGADVLVFTGYDLAGSPLLAAARGRIRVLNDRIHSIARSHGAQVLDVTGLVTWSAAPLIASDRVHPSTLGHRHLARRVADVLGLPPVPVEDEYLRPPAPRPFGQALREEVAWWRVNVLPQIRRWATNASEKEGFQPKWPVPVRPSTWLDEAVGLP